MTCAWRRALPLLAQNPVIALLVGGLALGLPVLALIAGRRLGASIAPAFEEESAARLFVASVGLLGMMAGAFVALLAPNESSLGPQLSAAPLSRLGRFVALTALPVVMLMAGLSVVALFFLVPFAAETVAGSWAAVVILAGGFAGLGCGASLLEACVVSRRRPFAGVPVLACLGGLWALGTVSAGGDALIGPLTFLVEVLHEPGHGLATPLGALCLTGAGAFALWGAAASARPAERPWRARVRALLPVPSRPRIAWLVAGLKRYSRRRELRATGLAASAVALGGALVLAGPLHSDGSSAFYLGGGLAALGAVVIPVAAFGLDREAEWLYYSAPLSPAHLAVGSSLAAVLLALALVGAVIVPLALSVSIDLRGFANIGAAAVVQCAAAVVAGALVPWRGNRLPDQLPTFGAFIAMTTALWLGLGALVPRLIAAGIPEGAVGASVPVLALFGALAVSGTVSDRRRPR